MKKLSSLMTNPPSVEGIIIFSVVGYETVALSVNFLTDKRVLVPITDILGPLTHKKYGKIAAWLFLGWAFDHFWARGEREIYGDKYIPVTGKRMDYRVFLTQRQQFEKYMEREVQMRKAEEV